MRENVGSGGIVGASAKLSEGRGIIFDDMRAFLRFGIQSKLAILNILYQSGSTSVEVLANLLQRSHDSVGNDAKILLLHGLVGMNKQRRYFVAWDKLNIDVREKMVMPTTNVLSLPVQHICYCAKKFPWVKTEIRRQILYRGRTSFSCSIRPTEN